LLVEEEEEDFPAVAALVVIELLRYLCQQVLL
jgi:hypothetical protein